MTMARRMRRLEQDAEEAELRRAAERIARECGVSPAEALQAIRAEYRRLLERYPSGVVDEEAEDRELAAQYGLDIAEVRALRAELPVWSDQ